jgi:hypothetical protein
MESVVTTIVDGVVLCFFSFLGVFWEVKCFNQKWLHHHQLESYSKEDMCYSLRLEITVGNIVLT